ncbi:MAG: hypothetical protein IKQ08_12385 [Paludibacteraceae bacterium]|nr:hypothetical protein [Paludibacteraceae bacterium]
MIRNKLRCAFLSTFILIVPTLMHAKNADIKRVELDKTSSNDFKICSSIGEKGLLLGTIEKEKQKGAEKKHEIWTITKMDTLLNNTASIDITVGSNCQRRALDDDGKFFLISSNFGATKWGHQRYEITILDYDKMTTTRYDGSIDKYFPTWEDPMVLGDYLYMLGEAYFSQPFMLITNIKTGESNFVDINTLDKKNYAIMSYNVDKTHKEVHVLTKEKNGKEGYVTKLYTFSDGKKTNEMSFNVKGDKKYPATAFVSKLNDGNYLFSGTYSLSENSKMKEAVGIFVLKTDSNGKTLFSTFTNFLDLKNFTSYMSDKNKSGIEVEKSKSEANGKELTKEYNILPYNAIENDGKYLLIGEAYYSVWETEVDKNGVSGSHFLGYNYTHYFIVEYNNEGKVEWSNAAKLNVKMMPVRMKHLAVNKDANSLQIVYPSYGCVVKTSYDSNGDEISTEKINYVGDEETIRRYFDLDTEYWYGTHFLATGKLLTKSKEGREKVYSILKITY